ncbi:hypothetical protein C5167_028594 [Papaver somniferum]|nr:hypothetical protein C5167_028594 [Papaver somniferum]
MGTKNVKVFIWMSLVVGLLLVSCEVSAVKDLAENTQVQTTENNGVKDRRYGVSLVGRLCGSKGCCEFAEGPRNGYVCTGCCK